MTFQHRDSSCLVWRKDQQALSGPIPEATQAKGAVDDAPDFANSPLPAAMLAVAHEDSPHNRQTLYESMLHTWFVVPAKEAALDQPGF